MLGARRLPSIAVVVVLGLLTLTGCRSDPSVAAYVGSTKITDAKVTQIVEQLFGGLPAEQRESVDEGSLRDQVVQFLVLREVVGQYAAEENIDVPKVDVNAFATQQNLPPDTEFTTLAADYNAALGALAQKAKPVQPTADDQLEAYENLTIDNKPLQQPFDEVKQFFNTETLGQSLGMREMLTTAVQDANVAVNPRYNPTYQLPVEIQNARSWFAVELGGSAPVRDAPAPQPPAQGQNGQG
jgi:hypothetical protein